jgi:uncharacterized membrane protein YdjX (TVP38/TMEM64 family)
MNDIRQGIEILPWVRMLTVVLVLAAFVIVPFMLWGEQMDANMPQLVQDQTTQWAVAWIGIALLVLDVLLPVPSSVVSMSLCFLLGPLWGGLAVLVGMVGAFAAGFWLGQLIPTSRIRSWVGAQTWDAVASTSQTSSLWWIAVSRPLPVLAEVTSVMAGSLRVPFGASFAAAALSSLLVASAYGASAWLGLGQMGSSAALLALSAVCVPAASWAAFQWWRRRHRGVLQE